MKLEIKDIINHIERLIRMGKSGFTVDVRFGKLFVEVNTENYGPEISVIADEWSNVSNTYNLNNKKGQFDYYICIANPTSNLNLHLKVVEAIYRVMFLNILNTTVSDDIIDAAVLIHRYEQEGRKLTVNMLTNDFCKYNLGLFVRNDDMVKYLVRSNYEYRFAAANRIINDSIDILEYEARSRYNWLHNYDNYYKKMIGLIIYAAKSKGINIHNNLMSGR